LYERNTAIPWILRGALVANPAWGAGVHAVYENDGTIAMILPNA
jgi:hypothetical protein